MPPRRPEISKTGPGKSRSAGRQPRAFDGNPPRLLPSIDLMGVALNVITEVDCVDHILAELTSRRGGWVVTPNLDHLSRLVKDESMRTLYERASVCVADGMPLIWAARLQGTPLPERVAGSNLVSSLAEGAARDGRRVFFLGGDPGTAEDAANSLKERFPELQVAGTLCPEMGFEDNEDRMDAVSEALTTARPDIVFVALGSPKQELFIDEMREQFPSAWWLGIGISFSFLSGDLKRAPLWMQKAGMEWAHRLLQEPRRLARRYLVDGLPFASRLLATSLFIRAKGSARVSCRVACDEPHSIRRVLMGGRPQRIPSQGSNPK